MANTRSCLQCLCCITLAATSTLDVRHVRIAAFNVQVFGATKLKNAEAVNVIIRIIQRYDIILIQEIRDATGDSIRTLLQKVNDKSEVQYEMLLSDRLGRTRSKEQYAFFYKVRRDVAVIHTEQYADPEDRFEREPYAVLWKLADMQLATIGLHVDPDTAAQEIDALQQVHAHVARLWSTNNILIMGDLNAARPYLSRSKREKLSMRDPAYSWLISDSVDTTIGKADSAYDRFIATGEELLASLVPGSAGVFRYDQDYSLTPEQAKAVSDHVPIELMLNFQQGSPHARSSGPSRSGLLATVQRFFSSCLSPSSRDEL